MKPQSDFTISKISFVCAVLLLLTACNDDDESNAPPEETTFPVTMYFYDIIDAELLLWIGGEPVSTEGLAPEDLFPGNELEGMSEAHFENAVMIFSQDSLHAPDSTGAQAYTFVNDSLFTPMNIWENTIVDVFIGVGDYTAFQIPLGAYRFCFSNENFSHCGSGGGVGRTSFETVIADDNTLSADIIGPQDSLAVYNITVRLRP